MQDEAAIAAGRFEVTVSDPNTPGSTLIQRFRYGIGHQSISFYRLSSQEAVAASNIWSLLKASGSPPQVRGHIVLTMVPASPYDAFYGVTITATGDDLTTGRIDIAVTHDFASHNDVAVRRLPGNLSTNFQSLDLKFTQPVADTQPLAVTGSITGTLAGDPLASNAPVSLNLTASLTESGLTFSQSLAAGTLALNDIGQFIIKGLTLTPVLSDRHRDLQVLYTFDEGTGDRVYDSAGTQSPIDLAVKSSGTDIQPATWGTGSHPNSRFMEMLAASLVTSEGVAGSSRQLGINALMEACRRSESITIAAWVQPNHASQGGPARIVTLSKNVMESLFTLGHGISSQGGREAERLGSVDGTADRYKVRLRTHQTTRGAGRDDSNEADTPSVVSVKGSVTTEAPTWVVYTRDKDGVARLYLNGERQAVEQGGNDPPGRDAAPQPQINIPGNFNPWRQAQNDVGFELALGNEASTLSRQGEFRSAQNRPWLGKLYRVAVYSRALSPEEIYQLYYPAVAIALEGDLSLEPSRFPAPLTEPLPARLSYRPTVGAAAGAAFATLAVTDRRDRTITPQFKFTAINLLWTWATAEAAATLTSGAMVATLWGNNELNFEATPDPGFPGQIRTLAAQRMPAGDARTPIVLDLEGFNQALRFQALELRVVLPPETSPDGEATWQLYAPHDMAEVVLPNPAPRPVDFKTDFTLKTPDLAIANGRVVLQGTWLSRAIAFYGDRHGQQFFLTGPTSFDLPFRLAADLRGMMRADLSVELSPSGFAANTTGRLSWQPLHRDEPAATAGSISIPEFLLMALPTSPNAILAAVLAAFDRSLAGMLGSLFDLRGSYSFRQAANPTDNVRIASMNQGLLVQPILAESDAEFTAESTPESRREVLRINSVARLSTQLPGLFKQPLTEPITVGAFSLSPALELTVDRANIPDDSSFKDDYREFLRQVDSKAVAGVVHLISDRLVERIPISIGEVLAFAYGFEPAEPYIDLKAGMRLRIDYQTYQFVHPSEQIATSGFVGSGTSYFYVNHYAYAQNSGTYRYLLGFDAFASQLQTVVQPPTPPAGASSLIDLLKSGYRKPFYRLVYPGQVGPSDANADRLVVLLGAETLQALESLTEDYLNGLMDDLSKPTVPNTVAIAIAGRAVVVPEIPVMIQGQPTFVSVGTTVRQVLERYATSTTVSQVYDSSSSSALPRLQMTRLLHEDLIQPRTPINLGQLTHVPRYAVVNFDAYRSAGGVDIYDLPLLRGDRLSV